MNSEGRAQSQTASGEGEVMSEWAKTLLADVARDYAGPCKHERNSQGGPECNCIHCDIKNSLLPMLERRLLLLLEVGEAMRQGIGAYAVALNASPFVQADTMTAIRQCVDGLQAWDAAKAKASRP